jgi:hypothetical protein
MSGLKTHDEVDAATWDAFAVAHSTTPYPQSTRHAEYARACYGLTPVYYAHQIDDARLQCLLLMDEARATIKWSCGPVLSGDSGSFAHLTGAFVERVRDLRCRIRSTTSVELDGLNALLACNDLLRHTRSAGLADHLGAMIKKDLTADVWESAVYRSAGKKRKTKAIVDKSKRDGISVACAGDGLPFGVEEAYLRHYRDLMQAGFARNGVETQDADAAARAILEQDRRGESRTFFALFGNAVVACLNIAIAGDEAYLRKLAHTGSNEAGFSGATYQALMAAAEWAQGAGLRTMNLTLARLAPDRKTRNIRQFKTRFGGTPRPVFEFSGRMDVDGPPSVQG